jgi:peptidoglycan/LPS O-acetylase OafA/YrhL
MPKRSAEHKPVRREIELDFIRGIAILLVVDFHMPRSILMAPFARFGFHHFGWAGVDLFFVLSGFLVGGLLVKEWQLRGHIESGRFLIRRGFKIWPQYYVFLLVMLLTGHRGVRQLWGNLLNIQNYVGGVAHTWSLAVEEHAYLLLVGMAALAVRFRTRIQIILGVIVCMILAVLTWRTVLAMHGVNIFSRTDTRMDGILDGLVLAILYHDVPAFFRRAQRWTPLWASIVLVALIDFQLQSRLQTWWSADFAYFCADAMGVALLMLLYRHDPAKRRPLLYRIVAWVGLYSYGIYLWHVSVVAFSEKVAQRLPGAAANIFLMTCTPLLGIAIGVLTTKLVEFPALALRDRLFPRRIDSAAGIPAEVERALDLHALPESVSVSAPT